MVGTGKIVAHTHIYISYVNKNNKNKKINDFTSDFMISQVSLFSKYMVFYFRTHFIDVCGDLSFRVAKHDYVKQISLT